MSNLARPNDGGFEQTDLPTSVSNMLEEARMLLPGAQTLFGFQLIVVFEQSFGERLSTAEQHLHLAATVLTAISIALLMAPAAYHRQVEPQSVSLRFLGSASRQLTWGTAPLAIALCFEIYLIATLIATNWLVTTAATGLLVVMFGLLWYVLPRRATSPREPPGASEMNN
jgi:hypothetical protein